MKDHAFLNELLVVNRAPTHGERVILYQLISSSDEKITTLRATIVALKEQIHALQRQEKALHEDISTYKRALAPFR